MWSLISTQHNMQSASAPRECGWPQGKDALGDIPDTDSGTKIVALLPYESTLISLHHLTLIRHWPGTSEKHRGKNVCIYVCIFICIWIICKNRAIPNITSERYFKGGEQNTNISKIYWGQARPQFRNTYFFPHSISSSLSTLGFRNKRNAFTLSC